MRTTLEEKMWLVLDNNGIDEQTFDWRWWNNHTKAVKQDTARQLVMFEAPKEWTDRQQALVASAIVRLMDGWLLSKFMR